jgi:hypothetical protein
MRLLLYVTAGCHLCEEAQAVLAQTGLADDVQAVEIGYDSALADRYGWRIPVLRIEPGGSELDWPFSISDVLSIFSTSL